MPADVCVAILVLNTIREASGETTVRTVKLLYFLHMKEIEHSNVQRNDSQHYARRIFARARSEHPVEILINASTSGAAVSTWEYMSMDEQTQEMCTCDC